MTEPSSKLPNLNTETEEFISAIESESSTPLYELSPEEARKFLLNIQKKTHKDITAEVQDIEIDTQTAGKVQTRIIKPENTKDKLPAILYIHGGGWIMGNKETHDMLIKKLALCTNSAVIFPEYTPSPEAHFPTAINQIYGVLEEIYRNGKEYNLETNKIIIAGDSAGGNMATAIAIKTKKENGPDLIAQILLYPVTNADMDTKSYENFKDGPWLSKKAMEWFWNAYAPNKKDRESIYISPLKASQDDLKNLPPALVITDENDVLRDEGEAYARKLEQSGVKVISIRINGTHHDFMLLNALIDTEPAKGAFAITCNYINTIFNK